MSTLTLLIVAIVAAGLLIGGVRVIMTFALEHDRSFRTDLDASVPMPLRESV